MSESETAGMPESPSTRTKSVVLVVLRVLASVGFDVPSILRSLRRIPSLINDGRRYRKVGDHRFPLRLRYLYPVLADYDQPAGAVQGHYFLQDLWAARRVYKERPASHTDIGSRVDGFVAHILTFMPVTVVDIRPLDAPVEGLTYIQDDATRLLSLPDESVESLSCLHALEHFGLGRYGDPVEPNAWERALDSFQRVLRRGGRLLLSVPIGRERVEYNAHRIFSPRTIVSSVPLLRLESFSAIGDAGQFVIDTDPGLFAHSTFACGLFEFTKKDE